jgi:NAD(P)-dependent dehydrogenase (short-subunit alcohol dehydrogenase family)
MGRLEGRVAVVTGGATGIGRAIAERLVGEGALVAIGQLRAHAHTAPADARLWELDVRDAAAVEAFVARAVDELGAVHIAVSNAAITGPPALSPLLTHSVELFRDIVDTNLVAPFVVAQAAARAMIAGGHAGRIINIASVNSFVAEEFAAGYVSAKAGLVGLTRACAVDLAPHGITVNAVAPGQIFSEAGRAADELRGRTDALTYRHYRDAPLGAGGEPADVAGAVVYLASDDARWVSGTTLVVDGAYLAS